MNALSDRHIQVWVLVISLFVVLVVGLFVGARFASDTVVYDYAVSLEHENADPVELQYGIWPALANTDFYTTVRDAFIAEKTSFVDADLHAMEMRVYRDGVLALTVPIKSKGKEGSWWETPAGLYKAAGKEDSHFSSFGHVYMPYSIPFQGNFFIHGWPHHADGTPVPDGYSGGCMRLEDTYAAQVYALVDVGMPILVHEEPPINDAFTYQLDAPDLTAQSYLVTDLENNFVLSGVGAETRHTFPILSHIMAALVATEYLNIEQTMAVSAGILPNGTSTYLTIGSSYRLYDLLFPLLMAGSDDALRVIASHIGSDRLVSLMNAKAQSVGMRQTHFADLLAQTNKSYTTAEDMFMFLKYLHRNRTFLLHMSAGNSDSAVYGPPVFDGITSTHPLARSPGFVGGMAMSGVSPVTSDTAAAVLLVFASSTRTVHMSQTEAMFSVVEQPFGGGVIRPLGIVVFGSADVAADTNAILRHVERMYH